MTRVPTATIVFAAVVAVFSIVALVLIAASQPNAPTATPRPTAVATGPTLAPRTPSGPGAANSPANFIPALDASWNQAGSATIVCWVLTTTPPQRSAPAAEKIEGPGIAGPAESSIGTDTQGTAKGAFVVNQQGTYTLSATVGGRTATKVLAIRSARGPRPCG